MSSWREPYFTDGNGREWHVYDCVPKGRSHRVTVLQLGDPAAELRIFVTRNRTRVRYRFHQDDPRAPSAELLEAQLRLAKSGEAWANTFQPTRRARR